jgi:hypothetical protein
MERGGYHVLRAMSELVKSCEGCAAMWRDDSDLFELAMFGYRVFHCSSVVVESELSSNLQ